MRFRTIRPLLLAAAWTVALASTATAAKPTPFPEPSSAQSLFQNRPIGVLPTPTPEPTRKPVVLEKEEPIPDSWWIGGIAAAALVAALLLYGAYRAWRSSNLFDRQYRFPTGGEAALRFGALRSGGHMATIRFGEDLPVLKAEDR